MRFHVAAGPDLPREAAAEVADEARRALAERDRFTVAVSGGRTPAAMLAALADCDLPWERIHIFQVDERAVPDDHPDRNWAMVRSRLIEAAPVPAGNAHPMPAADADLDAAAERYAATLRRVCGDPPTLDLVHLGLGADGHTASLAPGDPVVDVADRDVAATGVYASHRRLTLTVPAINRAQKILWLVAGTDKADALTRLAHSDPAVPASRIASAQAVVVTDLDPPADRGERAADVGPGG